MKIAFIGTHGTGKTTAAYNMVAELRKNGINAGLLSETARLCPFPINEDTTHESQEWIILSQIIREIEAEKIYDILVCDRTSYDALIYLLYLYNKKINSHAVKTDYINDIFYNYKTIYTALLDMKIKNYKYIIYMPINDSYLIADGVRSINKEFQKAIDDLIKEYVINDKTLSYECNIKTKDDIENIINELIMRYK